MDRRRMCQALAAGPLAAALPARAQARRTARVAWISTDQANPEAPFLAAFRRGMRQAGWVEGRDLVVEPFWSDGLGERIERTVAQAVATKPDVIVAAGGFVVRPLMIIPAAPPVVFSYSGDAAAGGIVESYARPGVNRTGVSLFSLQLVPKRLELMKETLPGMKRVAIFGWPRHAGEPAEVDAVARAATGLSLAHQYFPVTSSTDLDASFERALAGRPEAILAFADGVTIGFADRFAAFSKRHRIPAVSGWAIFAEKGNLMSYGPRLEATHARLAEFVDRILKGAKPSEMPVELPSVQELVVNRRTAKEIGIAMPASVLTRADRLID